MLEQTNMVISRQKEAKIAMEHITIMHVVFEYSIHKILRRVTLNHIISSLFS